jgi:hypothetical protein
MFMAAIMAAFWYLRAEEVDREQEALRRDVEYAQQRCACACWSARSN